MESLDLILWHEAVLERLRNVPFIVHADTYPDIVTALPTPCVFLTVNGWDNTGNGSGQTEVALDVELFLVCDKSAAEHGNPEIYSRALAAQLSQWVHGNVFGLISVKPAVFTSAQRDDFDPQLDGYIVMRIGFTQEGAFGADMFAREGAPLRNVMLGFVPETGPEHIDDYIPIVGSFPGSRPP